MGGKPVDRRRKYIRALLNMAGYDRALLIQWIDEVLAIPPEPGQPRKDYFRSFEIKEGPPGFYTVHFHVSNIARPFIAVVRRDRKETRLPWCVKTMTLHEAMREVAKYAFEELAPDPARVSIDINATAIWLVREVRKKLKDSNSR